MTKNDFPSPLHKERQVRGHSCWGRLMVLPDAGTLERLTSPWRRRTKLPSEEPGRTQAGLQPSVHAERKITRQPRRHTEGVQGF